MRARHRCLPLTPPWARGLPSACAALALACTAPLVDDSAPPRDDGVSHTMHFESAPLSGGDVDADTPPPTRRAGAALVYVESDFALYAVGGVGEDGAFAQALERFDLATHTWSARAPWSTARAASFFSGVSARVCAFTEPAVDCYDPSLDAWAVADRMPTTLVASAPVALSRGVYVLGGVRDIDESGNVARASTDEAFLFHPADGSWSALDLLPLPRGGGVAVASAPVAYVLGGFTGAESEVVGDTMFSLDPELGVWREHPQTPARADFDACGAVGGRVITIARNTERRVDVFDPATGAWSAGAPVPFDASARAALVDAGERMLALTDTGLYAYDVFNDAWSEVGERDPLAHDAAFVSAVVTRLDPTESRVYFLGAFTQ